MPDTYDLGEYLLIMATNNIQHFDVVLPVGIADKGRVLNLCFPAFSFDKTKHIIPTRVEVFSDPKAIGGLAGLKAPLPAYLAGRSMVVKKAGRIAVECVVRGCSRFGSQYQQIRTVSAWTTAGMKESRNWAGPFLRLPPRPGGPRPAHGHRFQTQSLVGKDLARQLKPSAWWDIGFDFHMRSSRGSSSSDTKWSSWSLSTT